MNLTNRRLLYPLALSLCVACGSVQGGPQISFGDGNYPNVRFSGFGTLGGVITDNDEALYIKDGQADGATEDRPSIKVDSNIGLQATAQANHWLSSTVQVLTRERQDDFISTEVEWAFIKLEPIDNLALRAGLMPMPVFLVSDFRNVGFANTWVRPPNEVYGLSLLRILEGVDLSYGFNIGSTRLTASLLMGHSEIRLGGNALDVDDVEGFNVAWELDWGTVRVGRVEAVVNVEPFPGNPFPSQDLYVFTGIGANFDHNNIVGQLEFVTRRSKRGFDAIIDADGWYFMTGYRMDSITPYFSYAKTEPKIPAPFHTSDTQETLALGLRWDAFSSAAIKFQVETVDTSETQGISFVTSGFGAPVNDTVNVVSATIDFVF